MLLADGFVLSKQRLGCNSVFMATIEMQSSVTGSTYFRRSIAAFGEWVGNSRSIRFLEILSIAFVVIMAIFTATFLTSLSAQAEPLSPAIAATLLVANLLPATTLLVLFGRRLALQRAKLVNIGNRQRLHVRLVAIFSLISAVPTLLLVIFASLLFQSGAQFWFSGSARGMLENAGQLAQGYYDEKQRDLQDETLTMAGDLRKILSVIDINDPAFFDAYLTQVFNRKLSESAIITIASDGSQNSQAVISPDDSKPENYQWFDPSYITRLDNGEKIIIEGKSDKIEALILLFEKPKSYLYTKRSQSLPTFNLGKKAQSVLQDYRAMELRSRSLQLQFNAALYLVSLLIIAFTVWIALIVADRLVRPITNLVTAAQNIADGDLTARVPVDAMRSDEVEFLSQSFNLMTDRLETQTSTLLATNRQLDERRNFIETVLESVSAGIVSLDNDGIIRLANSTAEKLLLGRGTTIVGKEFRAVAPILFEVVENKQSQAVVQLGDGPDPLTVAVKFVAGPVYDVVTFEDISQQLADQRRAAWSDVARRIAHEIKNPLTPIQLAAERLQRRFGSKLSEDATVFSQLTATIIRQVGDLRNIVDEFSAFARMPKPVFRHDSLVDIIGHAIFLFEVAHRQIAFKFVYPEPPPMLVCDRRQLGQAVTNILKNAAEAIEENDQEGRPGSIVVELIVADPYLTISFTDNGPGLPAERERILEPYVTTRKTGSGLGLAIVRKIIEEHFAEISFDDAQGGGTIVSLRFSPLLIAERTQIGTQNAIQLDRE
jgi:two-component system, NtrC family, nitrogen regulation sensor histidine kinase NtrY